MESFWVDEILHRHETNLFQKINTTDLRSDCITQKKILTGRITLDANEGDAELKGAELSICCSHKKDKTGYHLLQP